MGSKSRIRSAAQWTAKQARSTYGYFSATSYTVLLALLIFELAFPHAVMAWPDPPANPSGNPSPNAGNEPPAGDLPYRANVQFSEAELEELTAGMPSDRAQQVRAHTRQVSTFFSSLQESGLPNPQAAPQRAIFSGRQTRTDYEIIDGKDVPVVTHFIEDRNTARQAVVFKPHEVKIDYDPSTRQLKFQRWYFDSKLNREVLTNEHTVHDVVLSTDAKRAIKKDENMTLFSTTDWGVLGGFTPTMYSQLFSAYIPFTTFYPAASTVTPGATIEAIEFATPEVESRPAQEASGRPVDLLGTHDLIMTIRSGERKFDLRFSYRGDCMARLRAHLLNTVLLLQSANPREEILSKLAPILQANRAYYQDAKQSEAELGTLVANAPKTLPLHVLANSSAAVELDKVAALLMPDSNGQTAFERFQNANHFEWRAADWAEFNETLTRNRAAEQAEAAKAGVAPERLRRSWGEVLASGIREPGKEVEDKVAEIAEMKKGAAQSLSRELVKFAKTEITKGRLTALGIAVAMDAGNIASDGKVNDVLFSVVAKLMGWSQNIPVVNFIVDNLTSETAKYAANYAQGYAFTSIVTLLGFVLMFQPMSYLIARVIAGVRNDRNPDGTPWSSAQAFFSYGGRIYARIAYPVQLWAWRLLAGQMNIPTAIEAGGGVTTPGALHIPFSTASAEAGRRRMSEYLNNDAVRRERSMMIAAIAVSEVLKKRGEEVDPATLMLMMGAHETGNIDRLVQVMATAPSHIEWERLATKVYRELIRMDDEGVGEIDAKSIAEYSKVMMSAVNAFAKAEARRGTLVGCATDACHWVGNKGRTFKTWVSGLLGGLITGAAGYKFYRKNKGYTASEVNAHIADHQYREDYGGTMKITAVTDSQRYPVGMNLVSHADMFVAAVAESGNQVGVYGAQGGVEQSMINPLGSDLHNPSPILAGLVMRRDHLPEVPHGADVDEYQVGTGRQETLAGTAATLGTTLLSPEKGLGGIMRTHLTRMDALIQGFQGKALMGYVPRSIALVTIALLAAAQSAEGFAAKFDGDKVFDGLGGALLRESNVIFNKMAILYGASGLAVGYAMIWGLVIWAQNVITAKANANGSLMTVADHLLEQGMRNEDEIQWKKGVEAMQLLYARGGVELPEELRVSVMEYTKELALKLVKFSETNPPLPSVISSNASFVNNVLLGSIISTVLANRLSHAMYNPELAIGPQLLASVAAFVATYFGMKWGREALIAAPKVAGPAWNFCANMLKKKGAESAK